MSICFDNESSLRQSRCYSFTISFLCGFILLRIAGREQPIAAAGRGQCSPCTGHQSISWPHIETKQPYVQFRININLFLHILECLHKEYLDKSHTQLCEKFNPDTLRPLTSRTEDLFPVGQKQ